MVQKIITSHRLVSLHHTDHEHGHTCGDPSCAHDHSEHTPKKETTKTGGTTTPPKEGIWTRFKTPIIAGGAAIAGLATLLWLTVFKKKKDDKTNSPSSRSQTAPSNTSASSPQARKKAN